MCQLLSFKSPGRTTDQNAFEPMRLQRGEQNDTQIVYSESDPALEQRQLGLPVELPKRGANYQQHVKKLFHQFWVETEREC